MILKDLHVHTTFSDGKNTPEEMVQEAIRLGLKTFGISDHSHTFFDVSYCLGRDQQPAYFAAISALKEKYRGQIELLCGLEQDYFSDAPSAPLDYIIGSVHYMKLGDEYVPVDFSPVKLRNAAAKYFNGDMYAITEAYYELEADVVRKTNPDIIGHFDLISKFLEQDSLFDENHPRYRAAWQKAADELLKTGVPFEMNSGAISRGYRTTPYPSPEIREYILSHGGQLVLSSDCHGKEGICFRFDQMEAMMK